jgi:hypothetical protein
MQLVGSDAAFDASPLTPAGGGLNIVRADFIRRPGQDRRKINWRRDVAICSLASVELL